MAGLWLSADDFRETRKPLAEASGMPCQMYLDPEVFALEKERIFKREWLFAGHVCRIRNANDYFTLTLLDHPLVITRGADGKVRAFHNVCRHRGMIVAKGEGNTRSFVCPYHAWSYDTGGRLIAAPEMGGVACFDKAQSPLVEVRSEIVQGIIFVNLDGKAAPLSESIPDLIALMSPWNIEEMEPAYVSEISGTFNWKTMVENASEAYHVLATHRESFHGISPAERSYSTDNAGRAWTDLFTPYVRADAMPSGPLIPGVPGWASERLSFYGLHPNFLISLAADSIIIYHTTVEGPESTRFTWTMYAPPSMKAWDGYDAYMSEMGPWMDQVNREDLGSCEGVHRGMKSSGWRPGRYSLLEKPVWQFHNWYLDRMLGPES
jgi:phenylpropionate dioxygenase-like ring-hydroxylating dioxygenase large terminal subunit